SIERNTRSGFVAWYDTRPSQVVWPALVRIGGDSDAKSLSTKLPMNTPVRSVMNGPDTQLTPTNPEWRGRRKSGWPTLKTALFDAGFDGPRPLREEIRIAVEERRRTEGLQDGGLFNAEAGARLETRLADGSTVRARDIDNRPARDRCGAKTVVVLDPCADGNE